MLKFGGVLTQHSEFIACEPHRHAFRMHGLTQADGGLLQHCIARLVAERVVDHLEVVQINEQDRKSCPCLPGPCRWPRSAVH